MEDLTILIVGFRQAPLTTMAVSSFERFRPKDLKVTYVVVENSPDSSYKGTLYHPESTVRFMLNPQAPSYKGAGSYANASAIELGKNVIETEYTFVCHSDVCVVSPQFYEALRDGVKEGYKLIGCESRAGYESLHICGLLVHTEILKNVEVWPDMPELDVGDRLTEYAQKSDISHCCFPFNRSKGVTFTACPKTGKPIFMHLGRGSLKVAQWMGEQGGTLKNPTSGPFREGDIYYYKKPNKATFSDWFNICGRILGKTSILPDGWLNYNWGDLKP